MMGVRLGVAVVLTVALQVAVIDHMDILGIRPDLSVLVLVFLSLRRGPLVGTLIGFSLGAFQDLLVPPTLGMNMLAKSVLGYTVGRLGENLSLDSLPLYGPVLGISVLVHDAIYLLAYTRLDPTQFFRMYIYQSVPTAIYTTIIGLALLVVSSSMSGGAILRPRGETSGGR